MNWAERMNEKATEIASGTSHCGINTLVTIRPNSLYWVRLAALRKALRERRRKARNRKKNSSVLSGSSNDITAAKTSAWASGRPPMPICRKKPTRKTSLTDHNELDSSAARGCLASKAPKASAPSSELSPTASKPSPPTTSASTRPSSTSNSS